MAVTFVGSTSVPTQYGSSVSGSISTQPGDVVLALVSVDSMSVTSGRADASSVSTSGAAWRVIEAGRAYVASGDPRHAINLTMVFAATATGAVTSGSFSWVSPSRTGVRLHLLVYRDVRDIVVGPASRVMAQMVTWPAVPLAVPTPGMGVHVWVGDPTTFEPTGATTRAYESFRGLRVSDLPFVQGSVVPGQSASGGYANSGWAYTIALLEKVAPQPPMMVDPPAGSSTRDLAAGLTVAWSPDGAQSHYQLRRTTGGTPYWWTGSAWSGSEASVTSGASSVSLPSLANGGAEHVFEVRTKDDPARPDWSGWATSTVTGMAPPTVTQVRIFKWGSPDTTAGGTLATRTPYVDVNGDAAAGATLTGWRAVIRQGSTVLFDTGITTAWWHQLTVEEALPNNLTDVYLDGWVYQNGTQPSAKTTVGPFSVHVDSPAAPTLATQTIAHPVSGAPGSRLSVATTWAGGGHVHVSRDGRESIDVAFEPGQSVVEIDDYAAPSNEELTYTAQVLDRNVPQGSSPLVTQTLTGPVVDTEWLLDPMHPETAVPVILTELGEETRLTRTSMWSPFTSPRHIVRPGQVSDPTGSMTLTLLDPQERAAVEALLLSGRRLILRSRLEPDGAGDWWPSGDIAFRVTSDLQTARVLPNKAAAWRQVSFSWAAQ